MNGRRHTFVIKLYLAVCPSWTFASKFEFTICVDMLEFQIVYLVFGIMYLVFVVMGYFVYQ